MHVLCHTALLKNMLKFRAVSVLKTQVNSASVYIGVVCFFAWSGFY